VSHCKVWEHCSNVQKWLNRSRYHLVEDSGWHREPCIRWGFRCPHDKGQLWDKWAPIGIGTFCHALCRNGCTDRFAVWVEDSGWPKEAKFNGIRQVAPMCPHGRAHWRHLANTTELCVCGGDAVFVNLL